MYKKLTYLVLMLLVLGLGANKTYAADGADISSLTTQEDFGVVYNECGVTKNALTILKNRGIDMARIRLFVNPRTEPQDLAYVTALAARCKTAGMQVMLCIHYSDTWADPGQQTKPKSWRRLTGSALVTKVYDYTYDVVSQVNPDYVQIGNETNCGMLWPDGEVCDSGNWSYLAQLIDAGVQGANDAGCNNTIVHISPMDTGHYTVEWFFDNLTAYTTSFSAIGLSFYPEWHGDISVLQACVNTAKNYKNNVMLCEIADYYTDGGSESEESQYQFVQDCQGVGASSVIYWEPAWMWEASYGYRSLFKPIDGDWKNAEMTKGLAEGFGGQPCGGSCTATDIHVESILCGTAAGSKGKKYGKVTVTVLDDCSDPASGVEVTGTFTGDFNEQLTSTTNSSGVAILTTSAQVKKPSYTFCVDDLAGSLPYDSGDNVETCDSN